MGAEVKVSEPEPRPLRTEPAKFLGGPEGLTVAAPPPFPVGHAGKPIGHGIEIRGYVQAVQPDVVAGVHDDGDLLGRHDPNEPAQELPRSHPAGQRDHFHMPILTARPPGGHAGLFAQDRNRP